MHCRMDGREVLFLFLSFFSCYCHSSLVVNFEVRKDVNIK